MKQVCVFLSTYNGGKYIKEQILSVLQQINVDVKIVIRDDGSTDNTCSVVESLLPNERIIFFKEKNEGYKRSFLKLLYNNQYNADYYAFCDQDDIWLPDKLCRAVNLLEDDNCQIKMYASALQRVDENLNYLSKQSFDRLIMTIEAELIRHRLAGCTFVFNQALFNLIKNMYDEELECSHDKLITIICLLAGGKIIFDNESRILYRRCASNASIDGKGLLYKLYDDMLKFIFNPNEASRLAKKLLEHKYVNKYNKEKLKCIANYRIGVLNTLKLATSPNIDMGYWYYNLFIRFMILLRRF